MVPPPMVVRDELVEGPERGEQVKPGHAWELVVGDDRIHVPGSPDVQGLGPVAGDPDLEAGVLEGVGEEGPSEAGVVHEEEAGPTHFTLPRTDPLGLGAPAATPSPQSRSPLTMRPMTVPETSVVAEV
jgi:hypothetical protein